MERTLLSHSVSTRTLTRAVRRGCDRAYEFVGPSGITGPCRRYGIRLVSIAVLVLLIASAPAAAQTNPVCTDDSGTLQNMIEGFVQITTALGLMGLLVVWQADSLMEMFTLSREQKVSIKQHKRGAMRSAAVLVVLGPLFTVAGSAMDLPIAQCVDLVPF